MNKKIDYTAEQLNKVISNVKRQDNSLLNTKVAICHSIPLGAYPGNIYYTTHMKIKSSSSFCHKGDTINLKFLNGKKEVDEEEYTGIASIFSLNYKNENCFIETFVDCCSYENNVLKLLYDIPVNISLIFRFIKQDISSKRVFIVSCPKQEDNTFVFRVNEDSRKLFKNTILLPNSKIENKDIIRDLIWELLLLKQECNYNSSSIYREIVDEFSIEKKCRVRIQEEISYKEKMSKSVKDNLGSEKRIYYSSKTRRRWSKSLKLKTRIMRFRVKILDRYDNFKQRFSDIPWTYIRVKGNVRILRDLDGGREINFIPIKIEFE